MLNQVVIPTPIPARKVPGYQMPEDTNNLLSWTFVAEQMTNAHVYWLSTLYADGRPHVTPLWGLWYKNRIHFDGNPKTGWLGNLLRTPQVAVHLPDGDKVVIIEGLARGDEARWWWTRMISYRIQSV